MHLVAKNEGDAMTAMAIISVAKRTSGVTKSVGLDLNLHNIRKVAAKTKANRPNMDVLIPMLCGHTRLNSVVTYMSCCIRSGLSDYDHIPTHAIPVRLSVGDKILHIGGTKTARRMAAPNHQLRRAAQNAPAGTKPANIRNQVPHNPLRKGGNMAPKITKRHAVQGRASRFPPNASTCEWRARILRSKNGKSGSTTSANP
jgi:hypothetical protein